MTSRPDPARRPRPDPVSNPSSGWFRGWRLRNRGFRGGGTRGITLIELVVAITILSIATLAAWRSFEQAQRGIGEQVARALAQQVALNRAAELRDQGMITGRSLPDTVRMGPVNWTVALRERDTRIGFIEAEILVSAPGQPGARLVAFVMPEAGS